MQLISSLSFFPVVRPPKGIAAIVFVNLSVSFLSGCAETTQLQGSDRRLWERCHEETWFPDLKGLPILTAQACEARVRQMAGLPPPPKPTSIMDVAVPLPQQRMPQRTTSTTTDLIQTTQASATTNRSNSGPSSQETAAAWGQVAEALANSRRKPTPAPAPAAPRYQQAAPSQYVSGNTTSSSSTQGQSSSVQDFPYPDAHRCVRLKQQTRGKQCNSSSSVSVELENICNEEVNMQLCLFNSSRNMWDCGARGSAGRGDTVYQYVCQGDGRYQTAGCSKQSQVGRFRNGNCGGDANGVGIFNK